MDMWLVGYHEISFMVTGLCKLSISTVQTILLGNSILNQPLSFVIVHLYWSLFFGDTNVFVILLPVAVLWDPIRHTAVRYSGPH